MSNPATLQLRDYVGCPSPLYFAERITSHYALPDGTGPQIYLKREDLNHTGAHKINNALAQVLVDIHGVSSHVERTRKNHS